MEFEKGESEEQGTQNSFLFERKKEVEILLIDDDPNMTYLFEKIFDNSKIKIKYASTGEEIIQKYGTVDVIITDISMAKINGINIMRKLKKGGYKGKIIAYTSYAMKEDRECFIRAGFDDYIARPSNRDEIREIIFKNIEKSRKGDGENADSSNKKSE